MIYKSIFTGTSVLIFFLLSSLSLSEPSGRACYHAKICVHNGVEKCGVDSKGNIRRFIDSCDIKEYNCLEGSDFVKTTFEQCKSLPPLEGNQNGDKMAKNESKIVPDNASQISPDAKTTEININEGEKGQDLDDNNVTTNQNDDVLSNDEANENGELEVDIKISNKDEEDNNDDVEKANLPEPDDVFEEKEVSKENMVPKRNVELDNNHKSDSDDVVIVNDESEAKENKEDSDHESQKENDKYNQKTVIQLEKD